MTPGAVTVTNDLTLNVRVRTSAGNWSALAQPSFLLASRRPPTARDLLVTEISYNPAGVDDYEFLELYNAGTNLLDLAGVSLSNAVRFIFPAGYALNPGAFAVVAKNTTAFAERYQAPGSSYYWPGISVAGQWTGSLDNAGETVSLVASNGVPPLPSRTSLTATGRGAPMARAARSNCSRCRPPPPRISSSALLSPMDGTGPPVRSTTARRGASILL